MAGVDTIGGRPRYPDKRVIKANGALGRHGSNVVGEGFSNSLQGSPKQPISPVEKILDFICEQVRNEFLDLYASPDHGLNKAQNFLLNNHDARRIYFTLANQGALRRDRTDDYNRVVFSVPSYLMVSLFMNPLNENLTSIAREAGVGTRTFLTQVYHKIREVVAVEKGIIDGINN